MPTIRGAEQGSKTLCGIISTPTGDQMVYKGLETVRTDWTPLAQQFQRELYLRIFQQQPYQDYVRDYVARTLNGELDEQLVYRKRLRRRLDDYQRNVPRTPERHVWPMSLTVSLAGHCNIKMAGGSAM